MILNGKGKSYKEKQQPCLLTPQKGNKIVFPFRLRPVK